MTFDDYQKAAMSTAIFRGAGDRLSYPALGLAGEAGEVAGKIKKLDRDYNILSMGDIEKEGISLKEIEPKIKAIKDELGDCLWYLAVLADTLGTSLEVVAIQNVEKLLSRKERGVIKGSGDER
jgi:NTP pyrophosphatase (non-canonical NTP hydrolase)